MKKSHPLVGIMLEGFQVFGNLTYIPLEGLTLLFGPNSAGKSALQDAIALIREVWNAGDYDSLNLYQSHSPVSELMDRHRRRPSGNEGIQFDTMKIGFKTDNADYLWTFFKNGDFVFELNIDSVFFLKAANMRVFEINLNHPSIPDIRKTAHIEKSVQDIPDELEIRNDILIIKRGIHQFRWRGTEKSGQDVQWLESSVAIDHEVDKLKYKDIASIYEMLDELGAPLKKLLSSIEPDFDLNVVAASRTVPEAKDLFFILDPHYHKYYRETRAEIFGGPDFLAQHVTTGNGIYMNLALSSLPYLVDEEEEDYDPEASDLINRVNQALSDHLFLDHGYQIDCEYRTLLSIEDSKIVHKAISSRGTANLAPSNTTSYFVNIFLRDNQNRRHLFEDVGSGIGYVLPVLCAIFDHIGASIHFIQQPELHLHPALQAALGDVFIEARKNNSTIVIETHSEHLLLRILKRIRQTHLQVDIAQELKIKAKDVCVLYFDPSPDGTTTVKRLRITEDGEFMDRWPRGFFGERDQELLDE
jgi:hypothetical protein